MDEETELGYWSEFQKLDRNGDNRIESRELANYLNGKKASLQERQSSWAKFMKHDFNKDGVIDLKDTKAKKKQYLDRLKNPIW